MEIVVALVQLALFLGIPLLLLLVSWLGGRAIDRRLMESIREREQANAGILATDLRGFPGEADPAGGGVLVEAGVVLGVNYLRGFWGGLIKIFGGEMRAFTQVMEAARREGVQRLLDQARAKGFDAVCAIRLDGTDIGGGTGPKGIPMVVLFASGTAYRRRRSG